MKIIIVKKLYLSVRIEDVGKISDGCDSLNGLLVDVASAFKQSTTDVVIGQ